MVEGGGPAERVQVEAACAIEIGNDQRDDVESRFHGFIVPGCSRHHVVASGLVAQAPSEPLERIRPVHIEHAPRSPARREVPARLSVWFVPRRLEQHMSQPRFSRSKVLGALAAATLMLGVGACGAEEEPASTQGAVTGAVSGEEVFKGLFFGEGPVAARLPKGWGPRAVSTLPPEEQAEHAQRRTQVIASLHEADPTFFERFGADIQSGDHLRIERALNESLAAMKRVSQQSLSKEVENGPLEVMCLILYCHVVTQTFAFVDQEVSWLETSLQRDEMAAVIAERLAVE